MKTVLLSLLFSALTFSISAQWSSNPLENSLISGTSGEAVIPKIATHPSGYSYVGFFVNESGNYDVRLQKLDVFGNKLWGESGILISNHTSMSWLTDWDMTVDADTCAVLVFQDIRNGNNNVYAYRVSPSGQMLWGDDGVALSPNADFNVTPDVEITEAGNYIFNWVRDATTQTIGMQKLNAAGEKLWGELGLQLLGTEDYTWPLFCPSIGDDAILVFSKQTGPFWAPDRDLYVQRFDGSGNPVWANDVLVASAGFISGYTIPAITSDLDGGVFISWHDERNGSQVMETYVQHVGNNGGVFWEPNGVKVCMAPNQWHLDANITYSETLDDLFVFWTDRDFNQNMRGLSGQRISEIGERLWGDNGKVIIPLHNGDYSGIFTRAIGEDVSVFFFGQLPEGAMFSGVYGYKFDKDGNSMWPGDQVTISGVASEKLHMDAGILNSGQVILAWEDRRDDSGDIFGQNIKIDGSLGPIVANLEVYPPELVYETVEQCLSGMIFTVRNNSPLNLSISNMELEGYFPNGAAVWLVEPMGLTFPLNINSGDSLQINVIVGLPVWADPLLYLTDTISIWAGADEHHVILRLNEDLISSVESGQTELFNIYPNPARSEVNIVPTSGIIMEGTLRIINPIGVIIKEMELKSQDPIKVSLKCENGMQLTDGMYLLIIEHQGHKTYKKLLID